MKPQECYEYITNKIQGAGTDYTAQDDEALAFAQEAMEKQIAQKVKPEPRYYGNGKCPSCNAVFLDKSTNYCGNCGQRLDWSEEDETTGSNKRA